MLSVCYCVCVAEVTFAVKQKPYHNRMLQGNKIKRANIYYIIYLCIKFEPVNRRKCSPENPVIEQIQSLCPQIYVLRFISLICSAFLCACLFLDTLKS